MESRAVLAAERHKKGYNCAQAVACTYCDLVDVSEEEAFRSTEAFGLGMGGMLGTCGALSGAVYLASLATSDGNLENPSTKKASYALSRELLNRFEEKNGSVTCRVLKGLEGDRAAVPCPASISTACELVEKTLFPDTFLK
ncbi:MAG: C-GCAxxG-C-C family protein [Parolsenella sp.]|uniref:C-GCAxxG-C-C family protein n=1 Tax=Parolsenella sp. TaxID=2083006 RepID=UPI002E79D91B|nr:C-GCAxxG-C-C family protein [Parolsenella sp.]MEE1373142.1 C-GCAxxG-C-C family protein [Parolsenella sp.]